MLYENIDEEEQPQQLTKCGICNSLVTAYINWRCKHCQLSLCVYCNSYPDGILRRSPLSLLLSSPPHSTISLAECARCIVKLFCTKYKEYQQQQQQQQRRRQVASSSKVTATDVVIDDSKTYVKQYLDIISSYDAALDAKKLLNYLCEHILDNEVNIILSPESIECNEFYHADCHFCILNSCLYGYYRNLYVNAFTEYATTSSCQ